MNDGHPAKDPTVRRGDRVLQTSQWVPLPLERTFAFFADARNLERITPPFLHFRIVTPHPIVMERGRLIDYRLRLRRLPIRWRTEITAWNPPHHFTDVQLRGPYRKWVHRHDFSAENGGTRVLDRVTYAVPGGPLINRFVVRSELDRIFAYRRQQIERLLAEDAPPDAKDRLGSP